MRRKLFFALTLRVAVAMQAQTNTVPVNLPKAEVMYDFNGNGLKQAVQCTTNTTYQSDWSQGYERYLYHTDFTLTVTQDILNQFATDQTIGTGSVESFDGPSGGITIAYIEDVNHDGKPDLGNYNGSAELWLSNATNYDILSQALAVTNMDLNDDGRLDYLVLNRNVQLSAGNRYAYYGDIMYQLADGSFQSETMQVMTWDEFVAQMTPEELDQYNNPQNYSLGEVSRYTYSATLGGWSLARAPKRNAPEQMKAPGIGHTINAPTKAVDLNGDGLMDLVDEKDGIIYTNMGNGKWVWTQTNGLVIPADLNNDGIMDFIFPGAKLYTAISTMTVTLICWLPSPQPRTLQAMPTPVSSPITGKVSSRNKKNKTTGRIICGSLLCRI